MSARSPHGRPKPIRRHGADKDRSFSSGCMMGVRSGNYGEHLLSLALLETLRHDPGVSAVEEFPEAFEWTDGADGRNHFRMPIALVRRGPGDITYVDAMPRAALTRNPELGGARRRLELECAARGAFYEVWTEDEILMDLSVVQMVRVADAHERLAYRDALRSRASPWPQVVGTLAGRLCLEHLREVGGGWVAHSRLTGIPMALLSDLEIDPETRMALWRPRRPPTSLTAAAAPAAAVTAGVAP